MTIVTSKIAEKLKEIRSRKVHPPLQPSPFISGKIRDFSGSIIDCEVRNYQITGIMNVILMTEFILGDEPGLGKTLQAYYSYAYLRHWYPNLKVLWVGPVSSLGERLDECRVMLNITRGTIIESGQGKAHRIAQWKRVQKAGFEMTFCSYKTVMTDYLEIVKAYSGYPLVVVFDEVHRVSNIHSKTHKAAAYVAKHAVRRLGISATIIKNRLDEAYGVFKILVPDLFPTKAWYEAQFYEYTTEYWGGKQHLTFKGYKQLDVFRKYISPYFLARTPGDVGGELPEIVPRKIDLQMKGTQAAEYDKIVAGLFTRKIVNPMTGEDMEVPVESPLHQLMISMLATNSIQLLPEYAHIDELSSKEEAIIDLLTGDLFEEKVVIFSFFKKWLYRLKKIIKQKTGIDPLMITGDTEQSDRDKIKNKFNRTDAKDPNSRVIMITAAGGESINLTVAPYIIFGNLPWSYGDFRQIVGRIARLGSKYREVIAILLCNERSVDIHQLDVLKSKQNLSQAVNKDSITNLDYTASESDVKTIIERLRSQIRR